MIRPDTSSKLLLVADRRAGSLDGGAVVRRFRLARLPLAARPTGATKRAQRTERD